MKTFTLTLLLPLLLSGYNPVINAEPTTGMICAQSGSVSSHWD